MSSTLYFKTQIDNIRKEALNLGFSIKTMDNYKTIWNSFMKWKNKNDFYYNEKEYETFLLEHYNFDVLSYSSKSKSHYKQLMRSKRILDDFDNYKTFMNKRVLPKALFSNYPKEWNETVDNYLTDCSESRQNSNKTVGIKRDYLTKLLSYFYQNNLTSLSNFTPPKINEFINKTIEKGNVSKRRNFYILSDFLKYLFIENIMLDDLSFCIPKIKHQRRKKIPLFIKSEKVEELLNSIPRERKVEKRDYCIILIAARLGLRISDILNIKIKDIDWRNDIINVTQPKTNNLNVLPLSKEIGWAIIDYIKNSRPICNNEYLFLKSRYPFLELKNFNSYSKYFQKIDIDFNENNKKGIHNLRNSLAENMLDCEIPLSTISSVLGHKNMETTANSYLKIDFKHLKECSLEVDENV